MEVWKGGGTKSGMFKGAPVDGQKRGGAQRKIEIAEGDRLKGGVRRLYEKQRSERG